MSRRRKVMLSVGLCIVIAIAVIAYVIARINQPVVATIHTGQAYTSPNAYDIDLTPKLEKGSYVSFDYPAGLSLSSQATLNGSVEDLLYKVRDIQTWILAIDVINNGVSLNSDSAYTLRQRNPQQYQQTNVTVDGQIVPVMTDITASGFSKVAFITHGPLTATVSLLGDDSQGTGPLQTSFDMVLNSWQWVQ